ncbi:helix-turn-helix transcriptional regulator [Seonamhaeicola sediminis]|uniref:Helix-turn-helix transcriptional regulator n=1 Tax=Seonamhaeicola sediminis TaxID=2528206 RepID=A0A562YI77_9FLAO|nr:helix-turn-helix domain-containing protein [Seonamhaeicola sediminis]TWO34766.1 helix-turn-helix transcriptional regulator [Seonamhaeicola sediminis]
MESIVNFIIWAALIQGFLLAMVYIFSKKYKSFSNFFLGMFLLSLLFEAFTTVLPFDNIGNYSIGGYFTLPEVKLFIPLFFMHYVLEKIGGSSKYRTFLRVNYILAILISCVTLYNLFLFVFKSIGISDLLEFTTLDRIHLALQSYAFVIVIVAFTISVKETLLYRTLVRNEYSDFKMLQIKWLWQLIFMLLPAIILWGIELAHILFIGNSVNNIVMMTWVFVAIFLYFLSFKAFRHPDLFDKLPESILSHKSDSDTKSIGHHCNKNQSEKIQAFMSENQSYLSQDLTLYQFSEALNMSPRLISTCLNNNIGFNFNEWVNSFRVDKAIELIKADTKNILSIEGIGHDSGFKSRSAMYAAFKKKVGCSPGYYRT